MHIVSNTEYWNLNRKMPYSCLRHRESSLGLMRTNNVLKAFELLSLKAFKFDKVFLGHGMEAKNIVAVVLSLE